MPLTFQVDRENHIVRSRGTAEDIRSLAALARSKAPLPDARMAIIASSDLAFGVSMMFKAFVGYGERLLVVRDEREAMAWVTTGELPK
jgi:hypothetical protein